MATRRPLVLLDNGTGAELPSSDQIPNASLTSNLKALGDLLGSANKSFYFTAAGAMALHDLTVFGRSVVATADAGALRTLLGLGTAATRQATTSATDTTSERLWRTNDLVKQTGVSDSTAGRVLLTGAGGLLGSAENLGSGFDWNTLSGPSRLVRGALNDTVNGPFTGAYWLMGAYIAQDSSGNNAVFHGSVVTAATVRHFTRSKAGGTWYGWVEEWHSGNFNPALKANLASPSFTGTVSMDATMVGGNALDNTESGWLTPTLLNSYTQGIDPVRYRRIGKFVVVTGNLRKSAPPAALQQICILPAGYRPTKQHTTQMMWGFDNLVAQTTIIAIGTDGVISLGILYTLVGTPGGAGGTAFTLIFPVG